VNYLDFFNLSTIDHRRVAKDETDPIELGRVFERVIIPIYNGAAGKPRRDGEYMAQGEIGNKRSVVTLYEDGVPLAVLGVCLHSRASKPLFRTLTGMDDDGLSVPWLVIRMEQDTMPAWVESWAIDIAWSLITHHDEIGE